MQTLSIRAVPSVILLATTLSTATAQLINGDFQRSTTSVSPWTIGGSPRNPAIAKFKTNGVDNTLAYGADVDTNVHHIAQKVTLPKGRQCLLTFHVHCVQLSGSVQNVITAAEVRSGTMWTQVKQINVPTAFHGRGQRDFAVVFTPTAQVDELRLAFVGSRNGSLSRVRVDNVSLRLRDSNTPWFFSSTSRSLSVWPARGNVDFEVLGGPGVANFLFMSFRRSPFAINIPGLKNPFWLDLSSGFPGPLVKIVGDRSGYGRVRVPVAASDLMPLQCVRLHMQPIAFSPLLNVQVIGPAVTFGFGR